MSVDHYENFPVASLLLPSRLRPAVEAIYAFARSADDLADEGDADAEQRLNALNEYSQRLEQMASDLPLADPLFQRLQRVSRQWNLPLQPFRDLLSAFRQDVVTDRYADFASLLDYCRRSANPVGELMLHLYRMHQPELLGQSNAICSALQLINFLQDVAIDWKKQRIYLPLDDLARFGITTEDLQSQRVSAPWRALMQFEIARARSLMLSGAPLALRLPGRIGWELRLVVQGGLRILEKIESADYDIYRRRPKLGGVDWLRLLWRALWMRP